MNTGNPVQPYEKTPGEKLDYSRDWTDWLTEADTISTSTWTVLPLGPTLSGPQITGGKITSTLIDGGAVGEIYTLTNEITTTNGLKAQRSIIIQCVSMRYI